MGWLMLGLVSFLGVHSVRMAAGGWRTRTLAQWGEARYKGLYSLVSLAGFALIVYGFGQVRQQPVQWWAPPAAMKHIAGVLVLVSFIFFASAYVPGNAIKARLHHPMVLGVKTWALAHLLANGDAGHVLLFGSFLAWAVWCFVASRRRDRAQGVQYPAGTARGTVTAFVVGAAAWAVFAFWLHGLLIGVRPMG